MSGMPRHSQAMTWGLVAVVLIGSATWAAPADDQPVNDRLIADAVEDEIMFDQATPLYRIDVACNQGVITLGGQVDNLLAKRRAARLARTVKGVRSVINKIDVISPARLSDMQIRNDVQDALAGDPATDEFELDVSVEHGRVTLSGSVESYQEKQLADKVAAGVQGVIGVTNQLSVDYTTKRPDAEIATEIQRALHWDARVDDGLIDVAVDNGRVTLTGTVGSAAEQTQAYELAWVAGVRSVDITDLEVARWARDPDLRADKYVQKSDQAIQKAVNAALVNDPRVMSFEIMPRVSDGVVTLRGQVDNLKAKHAAEMDAENTVGVERVVNRIKVRPLQPMTDSRIEDRIEQALSRDPYVDRFDIAIGVYAGVATLSGTVDSYYQAARAADVASRVEGVYSVQNNITVDRETAPLTYSPYVNDVYPFSDTPYVVPQSADATDDEIHDDIRDELFWSPFVDADQVNVVVEDGVATLTGTVDSAAEKEAARENAFEGGALVVDNDLIVVASE